MANKQSNHSSGGLQWDLGHNFAHLYSYQEKLEKNLLEHHNFRKLWCSNTHTSAKQGPVVLQQAPVAM